MGRNNPNPPSNNRAILDEIFNAPQAAGDDVRRTLDEIFSPDAGASPDNPLPTSPVGVADRFKMAFGNQKGNLAYLKNKFEDVKVHEDHGLVVKEKGQWKQIDPGVKSYISDPWEFVRDMADIVPEAVNVATTAKGAVEGAAIGSVAGPIGAIAGSVVGAGAGGTGSAAIRTSLGRALGTYDATPDDEIRDIGYETFLSAGGQAVGLGVKPTLSMLGKAAKGLKSLVSGGTKEAISAVFGGMAKIPPESVSNMIENSDPIIRAMDRVGRKAANWEQAQRILEGDKLTTTKTMIGQAVKELPRKYGAILDDLFVKADTKNLSIVPRDLAIEALQGIEQSGFGQLSRRGKSVVFKPWTAQEVGERAAQGLAADGLSDDAAKKVSDLVSELVGFGKSTKPLTGRGAAKALTMMQKRLSDIKSTAFVPGGEASLRRAMTVASDGWEKGLSKAFDKAGLSQEWGARRALYSKYSNAVNTGRSLLDSQDGKAIETFTKQLANTSGKKNLAVENTADALIDLLGNRGSRFTNRLKTLQTASDFVRTQPHIRGLPALATAAGAAATVTGYVNPWLGAPLAAGAVAQSTPRVVGAQLAGVSKAMRSPVGQQASAITKGTIDTGRKVVDFIKNLPPAQLKALMKNDQAAQHLFRTMATMPLLQQQTEAQILDEVGTKLGGGQ